jgi:hypothetical protein
MWKFALKESQRRIAAKVEGEQKKSSRFMKLLFSDYIILLLFLFKIQIINIFSLGFFCIIKNTQKLQQNEGKI